MTTELKRMRGIRESVAIIKEYDPGSFVTEYFVRKLVKESKITSVNVGKIVAIDIDELIGFVNGNCA